MHLTYFVKRIITTSAMAKSKFEYVKKFETDERCLPNCFIMVRIDGKGFHRFSDVHKFVKPNDERALGLMNKAAEQVINEFSDIVIAYGQSDEYSFVFRRETDVYERRKDKIKSLCVSLFSSSFVYFWSSFFKNQPLEYPPAFDARIVVYPKENLRDYLSWRQVDCHINNLHNTCFWKLVLDGGLSPSDAQKRLQTMLASDKNEMLFSEFNTNYNDLPQLFRKGTVLVKEPQLTAAELSLEVSAIANSFTESEMQTLAVTDKSGDRTEAKLSPKSSAIVDDFTETTFKNSKESTQKNLKKSRKKARKDMMRLVSLNCDIVGDTFWKERPHLLGE